MKVDVTLAEKDDVEFKIDNPTIAELVRVYLNAQDVKFAAWRREHPTKPIIMRIRTSSGTVKKAVSEAVSAINKDLDSFLALVKKK